MAKEETKPKKEESTEIVVSKREAEIGSFITQALAANTPVETMERLFVLHREAKADFAREQFVAALSRFQKDVPVITKNKKVMNKDGRTVRYQYAPLGDIAEQIKEALTSNNLAYTWEVVNETGKVKVICKITHSFGHSETSTFEIPIDSEGYMTAPQKVASALTFAKRYSLCNALGISTADEDTDATDVGKQGEAKSPRSRITFALRTLGFNSEKWSKEEWAKHIMALVKLDLTEKNVPEIASRLEVLVQEKTDEDTTVQQ